MVESRKPTDEDGWVAIIQDFFCTLWLCASKWRRSGEMSDLDELAEDGWTQADIHLAETKTSMRTDSKKPV